MEVNGQLHAPAALSLEESPVPTGQEAEWASGPVWMLWRREKSSAPTGNRTLDVQPLAHHYSDSAILAPHFPMKKTEKNHEKPGGAVLHWPIQTNHLQDMGLELGMGFYHDGFFGYVYYSFN
jgi:hypothetical protein